MDSLNNDTLDYVSVDKKHGMIENILETKLPYNANH